MTRKILLSAILILLIFGCYEVMFGTNQIVREKVASISQLRTSSEELNKAAAILERATSTEYNAKKEELSKAIKEYNSSKDEYDELVPEADTDSVVGIAETDLKDIYNVDFLWTIVGNYATENGINLKFDINKNTTSASSLQNSSTSNYVVCDLKFLITGKYINLADFIKDLEDDDRLSFEINDFNMQKSGEDLQVTLTVKEIKINADDLIESNIATMKDDTDNSTDTSDEDDVQTINSNTTNINTVSSNTTTDNTIKSNKNNSVN